MEAEIEIEAEVEVEAKVQTEVEAEAEAEVEAEAGVEAGVVEVEAYARKLLPVAFYLIVQRVTIALTSNNHRNGDQCAKEFRKWLARASDRGFDPLS